MIASLLLAVAACGTNQQTNTNSQASTTRDPLAQLRGDKCERQVKSITKGLVGMWDGSKVVQAELTSETEDRAYDITIDNDGLDTYTLVVSNDSHYGCVFLELKLTQSGG